MSTTGFYSEFHETGDSATELMNPPYEWQEMTARYLECGRILELMPEVVSDPFNPTEVIGSRTVLTDGAWVWPGELAYLVRRYGVMVPDDFADRMRQLEWVTPEVTDEQAATALGLVPDEGLPGTFPSEDPSA